MFALPLASNPPRRMERLFNASITRARGAGEAGDVDPLPVHQPVLSAGHKLLPPSAVNPLNISAGFVFAKVAQIGGRGLEGRGGGLRVHLSGSFPHWRRNLAAGGTTPASPGPLVQFCLSFVRVNPTDRTGSEGCWERARLSWKGLRGCDPVGLGSRVTLTVTQGPNRPQTGAGERFNLGL